MESRASGAPSSVPPRPQEASSSRDESPVVSSSHLQLCTQSTMNLRRIERIMNSCHGDVASDDDELNDQAEVDHILGVSPTAKRIEKPGGGPGPVHSDRRSGVGPACDESVEVILGPYRPDAGASHIASSPSMRRAEPAVEDAPLQLSPGTRGTRPLEVGLLSTDSDLERAPNELEDEDDDELLWTIAMQPASQDEEGELTEVALEALMEHHLRRNSFSVIHGHGPGAETSDGHFALPTPGPSASQLCAVAVNDAKTSAAAWSSSPPCLSHSPKPFEPGDGGYVEPIRQALGAVGLPPQLAVPQNRALAKMRSLVSQSKVRYQEDGFDLDLTYITPRIIAMGFPAHGREAYFRNPIDEVERLLAQAHGDRYRVYNLCSERDYDHSRRFQGNFVKYAFDDHNAPCPISLICDFVQDAMAFLSKHEDNVVAVHCKAGKGRTGVMVSCLLRCAEPEMARSAAEALEWFGRERTSDGVGVTIPSQKRYVHYYDSILRDYGGKLPPMRAVQLYQVSVTSLVKVSGAVDLYFTVEQNNRPCIDSRKVFPRGSQRDKQGYVFIFPEPLIALRGDLRFTFFQRNTVLADEELFHFWLNTTLCHHHEHLSKRDRNLDGRPSKVKEDIFCKDLCVDVIFLGEEGDASLMTSGLYNCSPSGVAPGGYQDVCSPQLWSRYTSGSPTNITPSPSHSFDGGKAVGNPGISAPIGENHTLRLSYGKSGEGGKSEGYHRLSKPSSAECLSNVDGEATVLLPGSHLDANDQDMLADCDTLMLVGGSLYSAPYHSPPRTRGLIGGPTARSGSSTPAGVSESKGAKILKKLFKGFD